MINLSQVNGKRFAGALVLYGAIIFGAGGLWESSPLSIKYPEVKAIALLMIGIISIIWNVRKPEDCTDTGSGSDNLPKDPNASQTQGGASAGASPSKGASAGLSEFARSRARDANGRFIAISTIAGGLIL